MAIGLTVSCKKTDAMFSVIVSDTLVQNLQKRCQMKDVNINFILLNTD